MSLYNGPPRPGARGGRAEFSWDNVKSDKDREFYLGHSVKATTGRWQKGKDIFWYAKNKDDMGVTQDELAAVKAREREMMAEALGLKPKSVPSTHTQPALEKHEVERLLKGGSGDEDAGAGAEADRMKGLGFNAGVAVAVREEVHEVMPGTVPQGGSGRTAGAQLLTVEQLAALEKASAAAGRTDGKAHKSKKHNQEKKEKKEKKEKRQKHRKQKHRERSRSPDSSSSSSGHDRDRSRHKHPRQPQAPNAGHERSRHPREVFEDRARESGRVQQEQMPLRRGDSKQDRPQWQHDQPRQQDYHHSSWKATGHDRGAGHDRHPADSSGRYEHAQRQREGRDRARGGRDVRSGSREREQEQRQRQELARGGGHSRGRDDREEREGRHGYDGSRGRRDDRRTAAADRGVATHSSRHHSRGYSRSRSRSPVHRGG